MDWIGSIKPFLSLNHEENDVYRIIKCLIENAPEITKAEGNHIEGFLLIASIEIFKHCSNVSIKELKDATTAMEVILSYILQNLDQPLTHTKIELLRYLCDGVGHADLLTNAAVTSFMHYDAKKQKDVGTPKEEKKMERNQVNLSILDHLTTPIVYHHHSEKEDANFQKLLIKSNIDYLKKHRVGEKVMRCLKEHLANIEKIYNFFDELESVENTNLIQTHLLPFVNNLSQIENEVNTLWTLIKIPIFEIDSKDVINHLLMFGIGSLNCSIMCGLVQIFCSSNGTHFMRTKDRQTFDAKTDMELDVVLCDIADKGLQICNKIMEIYEKHISFPIYTNICTLVLFNIVQGVSSMFSLLGVHNIATNFDEESVLKSIQQKLQQVLVYTNINQIKMLLKMLKFIYAQAQIEILTNVDYEDHTIEKFNIFENYLNQDRINFIAKNNHIHNMLSILAIMAYKKACNARFKSTDDTCSESTTYFNDTYSCSDTESEESGSFLGILFRETVSDTEDIYRNNLLQIENKRKYSTKYSPKDESFEFINLSIEIYKFLQEATTTITGSSYNKMNEINQVQVCLFVHVLKEIDKENQNVRKHDTESIYIECNNICTQTNKLSQIISEYIHNLLCNSLLDENMQQKLLLNLNISPWKSEMSWTLNVSTRLLKILVQVMTLKPQQEKEAACLSVWHRLIESIINKLCSAQNDEELDDINIEHAQIVLYLFYSLNLMQKKSILLLTAGAIIRGSSIGKTTSHEPQPSESKILLISRLLMFFEYMMKHLYTPPSQLLEQVELLLLQENFNKNFPGNETKNDLITLGNNNNIKFSKIPNSKRLYSLTSPETFDSDFKLDGLAWNFILCTPEKLKYQLLLDALVDIFHVSNLCKDVTDLSTLSIVQYTVSLCLKLLMGLPPSIAHIEELMQGSSSNIYLLLWAARCSSPAPQTRYLVVNSLVKQGLYTQVAEAMWNKLTNQLSEKSFYADAFHNSLKNCMKTFDLDSITLLKLLMIDTSSVYFYVNQSEASKSSESTQFNINQSLDNLFSIFKGLKETYFNRSIENYEYELPSEIAEKLISILSAPSKINEFMRNFVKQLSSFICQKDGKSEKEELVISYDLTFARGLGAENFIVNTLEFHLKSILASNNHQLCNSIQYTMKNILNMIYISLTQSNYQDLHFRQIITSMLTDLRAEPINSDLMNICKVIFEEYGNYNIENVIEKHILCRSYEIFKEICSENYALTTVIKNNLLTSILDFWCSLAVDKSGKFLFLEVLLPVEEKSDFVDILFAFMHTKMEHNTIVMIIQLFVEILDTDNDGDSVNDTVSSAILNQLNTSTTILKKWASYLLFGRNVCFWDDNSEEYYDADRVTTFSNPMESVEFKKTIITVKKLFKLLMKSKTFGNKTTCIIFSAFCQMGYYLIMPNKNVPTIIEYLELLSILFNEDQHLQKIMLDKLMCWLQITAYTISATNKNVGKLNDQFVENVYVLLNNIVVRMGSKSPYLNLHSSSEDDLYNTNDLDEIGFDDEESTIEESDDENLSTKMCTYLVTQKDFMNQHWYYCYTCNMFDGIGVCSICAKICHKNHDVCYAKYGNFFCDCGAKEDGSCIALTKKWNTSVSSYSGRVTEAIKRNRDVKREDNVDWKISDRSVYRETLHENCELSKNQVKGLLVTFTYLLQELELKLIDSCLSSSSLKCYFRAKLCLEELHTLEKKYEFSENLVLPALGSQEGAFENVRMNYSGEQGTIIRQLISTNSVRRVGLCCLSIPFGTKQHLVVAQDKGKISILQLSTLLKQVDAGKQKLMITKLNSANVPCSIIISLAPNMICDDLLAICGIKECHVLQFSCVGSVKKHVIVTPHLEAGNYIKRSVWLPSSLTKLALITAETVQIYELCKDANKAEYCFLLPTGKIRDCTFVYQNDLYTMYVISTSGHIYVQSLCEESMAKNGNYYITQILDLKHPSLKDVNGQISGGGVSIYYSHSLQMLFCSFVTGKNCALSLENECTVRKVFNIPTMTSSKMFSKNSNQPLFNWTEVACHPGLIFAMFQNSNNIAIMTVMPNEVTFQELKMQNSKVKIMDFIAIRHNISGIDKTSLIVLCEDGSLKLYNANANKTCFWLAPEIKSRCIAWKSNRMKRNKGQKMAENASTTIPVDFFEHCNCLSDIEFGGNDLLQLYSPSQIKHRLNTNGLFITSTKTNGFSITVTNNDSTTIITGFRVLCGSQDTTKAPTFISVGNRTISTNVSSFPRWIDFGLHRSEIVTIQNENRLTIVFGNSQSPDSITMVDSIKIYGTTKESFGWPEETEEHSNINVSSAYHPDMNPGASSSCVSEYDQYHLYSNTLILISAKVLEIYGSFIQKHQSIETNEFKQDCLKFLSNIALLPVPSYIDQQIKKLMSLLIQDRDEYVLLKERLVVNNVFKQFNELSLKEDLTDVDPELFYLLVKSIHQITSQKPNDFGYVCKTYGFNIVPTFYKLISKLFSITPSYLDPFALIQPGILHVEFVFQVLVDSILCYCIQNFATITQFEEILFEMLTGYNVKVRYTIKQSLTNFFRSKNLALEGEAGRRINWTLSSMNNLKLHLVDLLCSMLNKIESSAVEKECILPLMQILLSLMSSMKLVESNEKNVFQTVLHTLLEVSGINDPNLKESLPLEKYSLTLLTLKFLSLLMGKAKTSQIKYPDDIETKNDVPEQTAKYLLETSILQVCMNFLKAGHANIPLTPKIDDNLLKSLNVNEMHYFHPFFNKCDLKSQNYQLFQPSVPLLNEGIIRLIYQITKIVGKTIFLHKWFKDNGQELSNMLCDFMMDADEQSIRRITRKTLLLLCGSKDSYRNLKDKRCIQKYTKSIKVFSKSFSTQTSYSSTFDELVNITNDLKNCFDIAVARPSNWLQSCDLDDEILQALFSCSCAHNEEVLHTIIIKLISIAIQQKDSSPQIKVKDPDEENSNVSCCNKLLYFLLPNLMHDFVTKFLIHTCSVSLKWQVHQVLHTLYANANHECKAQMLLLFWEIFNTTSAQAKLSPHFIDLLGYFTNISHTSDEKFNFYSNQVLKTIKNSLKLLADHPSSHFYPYLHYILDTDGYYFDREPCLECNNVEIQPSTLKLSAIKADARFSTCSMILKLIQSYCISKIFLRITDIKKSKMVRSINILYSNHNIQATVDLKSKVETWRKAKTVKLQPGQTDIRIDFSLPITACNLMIEYVDFYETTVGCSETLQCPRCSAVVSSNPGICGNCGENVFQCHKCRAINYDEKDPFLCNSCGFSKFAKFDYTLVGKPSFLIDAIESDEERNKMVQILRNIIEKADRIYRQLQANKRIIELLLFRSSLTNEKINSETFANINSSVSSTGINKTIQIIAQKYCVESKTLSDDLCMLLYKIKAHRKSILHYDKKQSNVESPPTTVAHQNCYRCILISIIESLKLFRSLTLNKSYKRNNFNIYIINALLSNFHRGTMHWQVEVANLLANIVKDDVKHTEKICKILKRRFTSIISSCLPEYCIDVAIRGDLLMIEALSSIYDHCWEIKFKTTFELLLLSSSHKHAPALLITQCCLRVLLSFTIGHKLIEGSELSIDKQQIDFNDWCLNLVNFDAWGSENPVCKFPNETFLKEKYFYTWKNGKKQNNHVHAGWLISLVFNSYSTDIRQMFCSILAQLSKYKEKRLWCIDMSTNLLDKVGENHSNAVEFVNYFKHLSLHTPWQQYLVLNGFLDKLIKLISEEIKNILREEKLGFFLNQCSGYALIQLVEILIAFWEDKNIREQNKRTLLRPVLEGYLNIRKMSLQRNVSIEYAQEKLLLILENITSGNEEDITHFMTICIEILNCSPIDDVKTKVFAFERLCSLIHQDDSDVGEFFLSLEKDPQQEDFLQGRMLGNPYSSAESGLGPQMRDVKNKICRDCELIALLEDDNGMELLVSNKIINLDLLVKDIYKNIWLKNGGDRDTMKIVYRMRGLLGDATEEFVETVEDHSDENIDYEKKHRMANVVVDCGGLEVMLNCLKCDTNLNSNRSLFEVILKLFSLCSKVKRCQEALCRPEMRAMEVFLQVLDLCIQNESTTTTTNLIENLLEIMNTILTKAASDSLDLFLRLSLTFGGVEYVRSLLNYASTRSMRFNTSLAQVHLAKVLAALVYGNDIKMAHLCDYFKQVLNFDEFEKKHESKDEQKLELFCVMANSIEPNIVGNILKDYIMSLGIIEKSLSYILSAPTVKLTLFKADCTDLKNFISRPALKYVLRILTGLSIAHEPTQLAIAAETIPIIHILEQVSSDEHVGSLAENLLETLCTNENISKKVSEVRNLTKAEKKRMAMATREKQLNLLGMKTNEKGQVTVNVNPLEEIEKLKEETGLFCFICREGYTYQPTKVLGIYTYSKRTVLEEYETKPRKQIGYSTVTHFNIIHVDCHISAIRLARGREEWESASLQNTNTKCNGILPLWGPEVPEISFATCVNRQQNYIRDATQCNDINFQSSVHDLKLLLQKFAYERSFHTLINFVPYLLFHAIYILLSSHSVSNEQKKLIDYIAFKEKKHKVSDAYVVEGPLYHLTSTLCLQSVGTWKKQRIEHLKRLIIIAQARHFCPSTEIDSFEPEQLTEQKYEVYKPYLMMWSLVGLIYSYFNDLSQTKDEDWPVTVFNYIRYHDEQLLKASEQILRDFNNDYITCTSFAEFCDVAGLFEDISDPSTFITSILD